MARRNANYLEGVVATYEELKAQIDALTQEAEAARAREISAIVSEIRQTVRTYQIRPEQIFPQGARRRTPTTRREPAPEISESGDGPDVERQRPNAEMAVRRASRRISGRWAFVSAA